MTPDYVYLDILAIVKTSLQCSRSTGPTPTFSFRMAAILKMVAILDRANGQS